MYYQLTINETARNHLKEEPNFLNTIKESFATITDTKDFLVDRYGKLPQGRSKIYQDKKNGQAQEIGFLHSFWNQDFSHNSKKWYQTDWIEVCKINTEPVLI